MKHKLVKKLTAGIIAIGAIGGASYGAVNYLSSNNTNSNVVLQSTEENFEQMANFSISPRNPITNKYTLTINNADNSKGMVTFLDGSSSKEFVAGETIFIHVDILNTDYTIQTIRVHSQSNVNEEGIGNWNLGAVKHTDESYSFKLPNETTEDGKPNKFYDGNPNINVDIAWTLKKINAWEYDWMDNTDSGNYMIKLNQDFIFDDVANPELKMETVLDSATGKPQANVIYRIYMNGHNMAIKNMTIPSGVQLMFINNKGNTVEGETPVVSLTKDTKFTEKNVQGGIGRWGSVEFSKDLKVVLNLWVAHGYWDSNINE